MVQRPKRQSQRKQQGRGDLWLLLFITIMLVAATVILTLKLVDQSEKHVNDIRKVKVSHHIDHEFNINANECDLLIKSDLRKHPARTSAKYQQVTISEVGMKYISQMKNLQELDLSGSEIKNEWVKYIVDLPLRRINLESSQLYDSGLAKLAEMETLHDLSVANTAVTDVGVSRLKARQNLTFLNLSETAVTTNGIKAIAGLPKLSELKMADTKCTSDVLPEIPKFPALTYLDISMHDLNSDRFKTWENCRALASVRLRRCNLSDGTMALLAKMPALQILELQGNPITGTGLMYLSRAKKLVLVYADGCPNLTAKDIDRFRQLNPKCNINFKPTYSPFGELK